MAMSYEEKLVEMVKGLDLSVGKNMSEMKFSYGKIISMVKMEKEESDRASNEPVLFEKDRTPLPLKNHILYLYIYIFMYSFQI